MRTLRSFLACASVLTGCDALQPDRSALMATGAAPVDRPACTACHGYAPRTGSHRFHMDTTELRVATCYSCHAASIAVSGTPVMDSLFTDPAGNFVRTQGWPWLDLDRSKLTFQTACPPTSAGSPRGGPSTACPRLWSPWATPCT